MTGVPDSFILELNRLPARFTRDEVISAFPSLKESSVTVYLSLLTRSGHLRRVGVREFEKSTPDGAQKTDPQVRRLARSLENRVTRSALSRCVAWSDHALAPFTHDAFAQSFVVLEAPRAILPTIEDSLDPDWSVHKVRDRKSFALEFRGKAISRRSQSDVFVLANSDLRGTTPTREGLRVPSLERLFVESLRFQPGGPDIPLRMLEVPAFDAREALRIAAGRGETAATASFLTWAAIRRPDLSTLRGVRNEFQHLWAEE